MYVAALALFGLSLVGPPTLPDVDESPPSGDAPAPSEEPPADDTAPPAEDAAPPAEDAAPPSEDAAPPSEDAAPVEDEPIQVAPAEESDDEDGADDGSGAAAGGAAAGGAAAGGAAAGGAAAGGAVAPAPAPTPQQPSTPAPAIQTPGSSSTPQQPSSSSTTQSPTTDTSAPVEGPAKPSEDDASAAAAVGDDEEAEEGEDDKPKKLGGFRLFRIGIAPKIGYTHGTSSKNGLFDREKSIEDSIDNMEVTMSGAGDLGQTKFGGFQWGAVLDAEIVGINVWLDFHKFFRPGGMWSLLLGYDHEFGFGKRLRLDVGVAGGLNQVFLGKVLDGLYYDKDNPEAVNIGTLGVEGRAMVDLHIKLVGPLFTGPYAMVGYHYLWSANVDEVTAEKGLHYSAGWSLRLDFAAPKILGRNK